MLIHRHDGSQLNSTSRLLSSVSASSFPDEAAAKARTLSLPVSSRAPPSLMTKETRYRKIFSAQCLFHAKEATCNISSGDLQSASSEPTSRGQCLPAVIVLRILGPLLRSAAVEHERLPAIKEQASFAATIHQGAI